MTPDFVRYICCILAMQTVKPFAIAEMTLKVDQGHWDGIIQ